MHDTLVTVRAVQMPDGRGPVSSAEFEELLAFLDRRDWVLARDLRNMRAVDALADAWKFVRALHTKMLEERTSAR